MPSSSDVQTRNRELVDRLIAETLRDPSHPYRGKQVGVVNGRVAVVADDLNELVRRLQEMEVGRDETLCFEGGVDYDQEEYLWSPLIEVNVQGAAAMSETDPVFARNQSLADQINAEVLRDPDHPYQGMYVGLANGQLVSVGDDPDEVIEQLDQIESDPRKCYCFEAGIDYSQVEEIWSSF